MNTRPLPECDHLSESRYRVTVGDYIRSTYACDYCAPIIEVAYKQHYPGESVMRVLLPGRTPSLFGEDQ